MHEFMLDAASAVLDFNPYPGIQTVDYRNGSPRNNVTVPTHIPA